MPRIKKQGGLTLIEVLVVIGILTLILGMSMVVNVDLLRGDTFRSEGSTIISLLEKARSQALAGVCTGVGCTSGKKHGVCYDDTAHIYKLFQGDTYATRDSFISFNANQNIAISATPAVFLCSSGSGVVFDRLTGNLFPQLSPVSNEIDINITYDGKVTDIKINNEGTINW
jgi:prepilin-type N-terminal cleavage/methylation domain-containing protein